jgi:two-component system, NarL family, response regulator NreC
MKIILVDDHALFRIGARLALGGIPGFEIAGEASTARRGLELVDSTRPDIVLMDIALPGMDGVLATREIRRRAPQARVLIVTAHEHVNEVFDAFEAGASGYALKSDGPKLLVEAIRTVSRGERYVAPALLGSLATLEVQRSRSNDVLKVLSEREREIFRLAAQCVQARDIALELCIARKTVDSHLYRINQKLGLRTLAELVRLAADLGMLSAARGQPMLASPTSDD